MLSHFLRAVPSRVPAETITYISLASSGNTTSASFTFSSVNFGAEYPGRRIVIVVGNTVVGASNSNISSLTIGGVTATQIGTTTVSAGNTLQAAIYVATVPTGTSGNVVVNVPSGGSDGSRIILVHSLDSIRTNTVTGSDTSAAFNYTRTFNSGEIYIGAGRCLSTASESWTNATEQAALNVSGSQRISSATYFPAAAGSRTITFNPSSNTSAMLTSVVFTL